MPRYFAYGSNMSTALMRRQCRDAEPIGPARLDGWRFIVTADGYASIVPAPGSTVYGVLWRITPRDLAALNAFESIDSGLYVRRVLPVRCGARRMAALAYVSPNRARGRPRPGYQTFVVAAARAWKFPHAYVRSLARWAPAGFAGIWQLSACSGEVPSGSPIRTCATKDPCSGEVPGGSQIRTCATKDPCSGEVPGGSQIRTCAPQERSGEGACPAAR